MNKKVGTILAGGALALAIVGGSLKTWAAPAEKEEADVKIALPAEQAIASIRTAVVAKPGRVVEIEAESENGKPHCDVTILAADGKTYEVEVDVATNKVTEIELADNDEHEGKDDNEAHEGAEDHEDGE